MEPWEEQEREYEEAKKEARLKLDGEIRGFIQGKITELNKHRQSAELAGESALVTHADLALVLEDMAAEAREIAGHAHQWNEDDYCSVCGADGRA